MFFKKNYISEIELEGNVRKSVHDWLLYAILLGIQDQFMHRGEFDKDLEVFFIIMPKSFKKRSEFFT